jgi:hypothetical protein
LARAARNAAGGRARPATGRRGTAWTVSRRGGCPRQ